ncbi:MAG: class I SAM-dependent methyltransferase [Methyloceanibacter sp.]
MFETYESIFNRRGEAYHQAMQLVPAARSKEFSLALERIGLRPGAVLCDMPSGGGYLVSNLPQDLDVRLVAVDPSQVFARTWDDERIEWHLAPLHQLPIKDARVDALVSIAGLHHVDDRPLVLDEMRRVLRRGGTLCILEVPVGAITDRFLNGFVHAHNSMGHEGRFVDERFRVELEDAGFKIETDELCRYTWDFANEAEMIEFMRLMFWLDKASAETIHAGVQDLLGLAVDGDGCKVNWELQRIIAT